MSHTIWVMDSSVGFIGRAWPLLGAPVHCSVLFAPWKFSCAARDGRSHVSAAHADVAYACGTWRQGDRMDPIGPIFNPWMSRPCEDVLDCRMTLSEELGELIGVRFPLCVGLSQTDADHTWITERLGHGEGGISGD